MQAQHPGSQASSRGEAKDSALLSSRDAGLLEPPERPQGSPASSSVWSPRRLDELAELGLESAELAKPGFCTSKDLHGQVFPRADMCHLEHLGKQPSGNKAF